MRDQPAPSAKSGREPGYTCAICGTKVAALTAGDPNPDEKVVLAHRHRPFCSSRCQRIDLGNWLDERYVVPGPPATTESAEDDSTAERS